MARGRSPPIVTGKVTKMNGYEEVNGNGDTITCDNCSEIVENWYTDGTHAVCGECATEKVTV